MHSGLAQFLPRLLTLLVGKITLEGNCLFKMKSLEITKVEHAR